MGTLCGQNAEVAKRWVQCVGRMLKLQRGEHTLWAAGRSYKEVGTPCGQNADVPKISTVVLLIVICRVVKSRGLATKCQGFRGP